MIRVVLDTNIYITGFAAPDSPEGQVLRQLSHGSNALILLSAELEDQIRRVSRRVGGKDWAGLILDWIWRCLVVEYVSTPDQPFEFIRKQSFEIPAEDALIFLTALFGDAEFLVSSNREFLKKSNWAQTKFRCLTPTQFLEQYGAD